MGEEHTTDVINGYRILGALGRGGLGTTFEAVKEATGEHVALKRLAVADVSDWKRFELFEREARVLASLQHPAIPRYLDHFVVEGPRGPTLYLVQEIVRGRSLAELVMGGGTLDEAAVRQIATELLTVLSYLGQRTPPVVHRDLKPENVMRREDGRIALVDFGAARADAAKPAGGSTTVGTYGYMAPEQLHGVAVPATDIYGLACTMLFLLSGTSPAELPRQKLAIDFRQHVRTSPALASWLERALAPAPEDRFASADAALTALRTGAVGAAPGASKKKTRPLTWILASVLLVSVVGSTVFVAVPAFKEWRKAREHAILHPPKPPPALPERFPSRMRRSQMRMTDRVVAHVGGIFSVAYSPDGKLVASGGSDGAVKIWDAATKEPVRALAGQSGKVRSVTWTTDGTAVASAGGSGVLVQDVKTGATRQSLELPSGKWADLVAITPNGKMLLAGRNDGTLRAFDVGSGAVLWDAKAPSRLFHMAISPDGSQLATALDAGAVGLWNVATGKLASTRTGHAGPVDAVAWAPDGRVFFSAGDDQSLKLWHMGRTDALATATEATDEVWAVAADVRGKYVAAVSKDGFLRMYDAVNLESTRDVDVEYGISGERLGVLSVQFAPDGTHLVTGDVRGYLAWFNLDVKSQPERVPVLPESAPLDRAPKTPRHAVYAQTISMIDKAEASQAVYDAARAILDKAIADEPKNALHHVARAAFLRRTAKYDQHKDTKKPDAATELETALQLSPNLAEALLERAWSEHDAGDDTKAKADVLESVKLEGTNSSAESLLAELAVAEQKLDEAEAHGVKAIALASHSQSGAAYGALREVYRQQGDRAAYERAFELQIAAQPWSAWTKGNFADALVSAGEVDRAIDLAKQALAQRTYGMAQKTLADAYAEKGARALWNQGSVPEAKALFDLALASMPLHANAHYGLAAGYRKIAVEKRDKKALAQYSRELDAALRIEPHMVRATNARADIPQLEAYISSKP